MIRRVWLNTRLIASCLLFCSLLWAAAANAQQVFEAQATPTAVARESFETLKRRDIAKFVSLFHPAEVKRFKAFALGVFKYERPDSEVQQIRKWLTPFNSTESITSASGADLLAAFLKNSLASIPGFDEIMADAKVEILGEIVESPDKVHVISRTVMPRPQPVSCQKHQGRWYQLLNDETMRVIIGFQRKEHFRKKDVRIEDLVQKPKLDKIDAIGYVKDGDDLAQVLCRINMKIDDFDFPVFACYPVRNGEPAWSHLNDRDKTKLVEALRAKWVGR